MPEDSRRIFLFDDYELDESGWELRRGGRLVDIQPRPLQLLVELVREQGRIVEKQELLRRLWSGLVVSESALTSALRDLRRVLEDGEACRAQCIQTVRGRGYRFVSRVTVRFLPAGAARGDDCRGELGPTTCFVDREAEMECLGQALDAARAGQTRLVLLAGEPGVGKTRIAEELAREALARGVRSHFGRCHETQAALPFWPFTELLRSGLAGVAAEQVVAALGPIGSEPVAILCPELATKRDHSAGPRPGMKLAALRMAHLFDGAARLLRWVAGQAPRLLVLEDAHWADEGSLLLLRFLAQQLTDVPLLLVVTYRDVELEASHPLRAALGAIAPFDHADCIALRGLGKDGVRRVLESQTAAVRVEPWVERIHAATDGNPFFVCEIARILAQQPSEPPGEAASPPPVPRLVRDALASRLGRRSSACQGLLRVASVIGSEFDLDLTRRVFEQDREALLDALSEAQAAGLIRQQRKAPHRYSFTHALVREALIDSLPSNERIRLHAKVAAALEAMAGPSGGRLEEIAHHYYEAAHAGCAQKAREYAERAAERATRVLAFEEAANHLRRALELLPGGERASTGKRCALLVKRAELLIAAVADPDEILATYEEAVALARALHSGPLLAETADAYAYYALGSWVPAIAQVRLPVSLLGRVKPAADSAVFSDPRRACRKIRPLLEEALALLGEERLELRASLLFRLAAVSSFSGDSQEADAFAAQASDLAARVSDPRARIEALLVRWYGARSPQRGELRFALAEQMVMLGREVGSESCEMSGHICRAWACVEAGDLEGAVAAFALVERDPRLIGLQVDLVQVFEIMRLTATGRFDEAEQRAWESYGVAKQIPYGRERAALRLRAQIWLMRIFQGRAKEMLEALERSTSRHGLSAVIFLARALVDLDCRREARSQLEIFMAGLDGLPEDESWIGAVTIAADVAAYTQSRASAATLYEALLPYEGRNVISGWLTLCLGSLSRALGLLAATLGRWGPAVRHFEKALVQNRRLGSRPWIAQTELDYAEQLLLHGTTADAERAGILLESSLSTARQLGMGRLLERAERVLDDCGRCAATAPNANA